MGLGRSEWPVHEGPVVQVNCCALGPQSSGELWKFFKMGPGMFVAAVDCALDGEPGSSKQGVCTVSEGCPESVLGQVRTEWTGAGWR